MSKDFCPWCENEIVKSYKYLVHGVRTFCSMDCIRKYAWKVFVARADIKKVKVEPEEDVVPKSNIVPSGGGPN